MWRPYKAHARSQWQRSWNRTRRRHLVAKRNLGGRSEDGQRQCRMPIELGGGVAEPLKMCITEGISD